MAFLFTIWRFILSGPLEIASGCIGFAQYLGYLFPALTKKENVRVVQLVGAGVAALTVMLLYRRITTIGKITVSLWIGTMLTVGAVIVSGALHFDSKLAFDFPPDAFKFSWGFLLGLGAASRIGIYDYLGYYDVCYIGEEVKSPGRVIPRSILISLVAVALIYFAINLSLIGVVGVSSCRRRSARRCGLMFMEKLYGSKVASVFTVIMVLWTLSVGARADARLLASYAAAQNGDFFKILAGCTRRKIFRTCRC
jgi:amino acid transporter